MKKEKKNCNFFYAVVGFCALTACTQNEPEPIIPDTPDAPPLTITVRAGMPASDSSTRLSYEEDNSGQYIGLTVNWKETGEEFYVLYNRSYSTNRETFTQAGIHSTNKKLATFTGNLDGGLTGGQMLYAVYPSPTSSSGAEQVTFALDKQTGKLEDLRLCMYAFTKYDPNTEPAFSFRYLTAAVKLTLELPNGVTSVRQVMLNGEGIYYSLTANLTQENPVIRYVGKETITTSNESSFPVTDNKTTVYLSLPPVELSEIEVQATDDAGNIYKGSLPDATLEAGNLYNASVTLTKENDTFSNEGAPDIDGSTADKAYEIANGAQLKLLADRLNGVSKQNYVNKYYKLTSDIDLGAEGICGDAATMGGTAKNWIPINSSSTSISIAFDGGGHTIKGLYINAPNAYYQGLFGSINGASNKYGISNLTLENPKITGIGHVGALAGWISGMSGLSGCSVTGAEAEIKGWPDGFTGGLVGSLVGTPAIACHSSAKVNGSTNTGGLFGEVNGSKVVGCYATGSVTGAGCDNVGGLIGIIYGEGSMLAGCYATGNVSGKYRVGGLVGTVYSPVLGCYATGSVSVTLTYEWGCIIGIVDGGSIQYCASTQNQVTVAGNLTNDFDGMGGSATVEHNGTGITLFSTLRSTYVAAAGAQTAWGEFSIHDNGATPPTYTIEANKTGRILDGTDATGSIWKDAGSDNLKLWWEQ